MNRVLTTELLLPCSFNWQLTSGMYRYGACRILRIRGEFRIMLQRIGFINLLDRFSGRAGNGMAVDTEIPRDLRGE
jgi:hypothetical protein